MRRIEVEIEETMGGWESVVIVSEDSGATTHRVTFSRATYERLTGGKCGAEELVRKSFEFLLEREPKESILGSFDLMTISRYFPEFQRELGKQR